MHVSARSLGASYLLHVKQTRLPPPPHPAPSPLKGNGNEYEETKENVVFTTLFFCLKSTSMKSSFGGMRSMKYKLHVTVLFFWELTSLGGCIPRAMCPLDDAFLGQCIPCTTHPMDDASLGRCVHVRSIPYWGAYYLENVRLGL
jgi:hypothetical protein